jgi:hypothetical protein
VEKWSLSVTEGNGDDSELVSSLPNGDARGVYGLLDRMKSISSRPLRITG